VREIEGLGGKARAMLADVTDEAAVVAMIAAIGRDLGGVDILVNNAANRREAAFTEMTFADWHAILAVVLAAPSCAAARSSPAWWPRAAGPSSTSAA